ncbi:hypothetical protein MKW98_001513, partial [Papaver atlanticum]
VDKEDVGEPRLAFVDNDDRARLRSCSSTWNGMQTTDLSPWLVSVRYDQPVYSLVNPMQNKESYLVTIL